MGNSVSPTSYQGHDQMCEWCQEQEAYSFYEDPHYDTDTDSDGQEQDKEYDKMFAVAEQDENPAAMQNIAGHLQMTYALHKKRWRRFTGRSTCRRRFVRRKGKG